MFKNVLVAYDGSTCSEEALKAAMKFMDQDSEAKLHILNVVDAIPPTIYGLYGPNLTKTVLDEFEDLANHLLSKAREIVKDHEESCVFSKAQGNPAEEIVDYADGQDIDLIVIGSRGLGAVKGMLLGSVSSRVLQQANCHVLVVK